MKMVFKDRILQDILNKKKIVNLRIAKSFARWRRPLGRITPLLRPGKFRINGRPGQAALHYGSDNPGKFDPHILLKLFRHFKNLF